MSQFVSTDRHGETFGVDPRELSQDALAALEGPHSPIKAIRAKCLDCCCHQQAEVAKCTAITCALWPFRFGKNVFHARRAQDEGGVE